MTPWAELRLTKRETSSLIKHFFDKYHPECSEKSSEGQMYYFGSLDFQMVRNITQQNKLSLAANFGFVTIDIRDNLVRG